MEMQQKKQKRKHLTEEQKEVLVGFMEMNGDISTAAFSSLRGKEKKQKMMEQLANALNSCENGVVRTPKEWMKSWCDNKNKTKSKAAAIARHRRGTGGGPPSDIPPLTPWEERIVALISNELIQGHDVMEAGINYATATESVPTQPISIPTQPIEFDLDNSVSGMSVEYTTTDNEMTDHDYSIPGPSTEYAPSAVTAGQSTATETEPRRRKKRMRRATNTADNFENFMRDFVATQKDTNAAILELASSFKEGCKMIAESCNKIADAYSNSKEQI